MNILGVGGWELVAILVIMLIVAGPERMIRWAYHMGRYMAYFRRMWSDSMQVLQEGLKESGIDIDLPKDIPTSRRQVGQKISTMVDSVAKPLREPLDEVQATLKQVDVATSIEKAETASKADNTKKTRIPAKPYPDDTDSGTWSEHEQEDKSGFGTWSSHESQAND